LENELDGVCMLLGHDDRVQGAMLAQAKQYAWSGSAEARKINPEAHALTVTRRAGWIAYDRA
jgi:hypothetical protein